MEGKGYELKKRAARAADSYRELARVFSSYITENGGSQEKEKDRIQEHVTETLCNVCPKREYCWEERQEECRAAFFCVADAAERIGKIEYAMLPEYMQRDCVFGERLVEEWNLAAFVERLKKSAFQQMMEGKEALVRQLEETANCFRYLSEEENEKRISGEQKKELVSFLKRYHVRARDISFYEKKRTGREWRMWLRCDGRRGVSVHLVERLLSEKLGIPVRECMQWSRLISEEEREMVFREEPGYYTMTGVARSIKKEQEVSGDSFSFFYETDGEMAMILSDGMGSGEEAEKESEEVMALLEQMLSAGFGEETAIRLINSVLALRTEQKNFATLDISRVNLYSGTCEFIKIGSAATFLKRGKWMERVEAKTLPIGMVQQVDYSSLVKKLYDGDCIIMMSDGVLEAIPEEERENFLAAVIGEDAEQKPQVIAGRILNASLAFQNFEPKDDMTVLVCGVFAQKFH